MSESAAPVDLEQKAPIDLESPEYYINRELSLLEFQYRVLEEARDERNPLLERVKFLAIVGSNLDEFFMVRVAGLKQQIAAGVHDSSFDGLTPAAQLAAVRAKATKLIAQAREFFLNEIRPALAQAGVFILDYCELNEAQRAEASRYFEEAVFPVLTPLAFDPGRPFPHISNLSLNLAILIRDEAGEEHFARVKIPPTLSQLVELKSHAARVEHEPSPAQYSFVWLDQVILANLKTLFSGMEILEAHPFRVTRNADMVIQELEADDLLETIEESVRQRRFGIAVRLTVNPGMPLRMLEILMNNLEVGPQDVYTFEGPLAISRLMSLYAIDRHDLKAPSFLPVIPPALDSRFEQSELFSNIRREPILLHHPFDSFKPVVNFLRAAAVDPDVLAIKMTLYRIGRNSPIVEALLKALEHGKQVAVLVELKARFDEESNIHWARALEREGVHVVYGLVGLKTHCKIALVVRREGSSIRRYVHMSTGNYNPFTAQLYTDLGYFTCDDNIGADATDLFNYLTGYSAKISYRKLLVAPINLRDRLEGLIRREMQHQQGRRGHLIFKMNSLMDKSIIRLLYQASQTGVQVDLIVRGICCLRPGLEGISKNIRVVSIVGRFLEHSRIFYFRNGGEEEIYLGSADLMPRNLNHRIEALFPVESPKLVQHLRDDVLATYLADNTQAREMLSDGSYRRLAPRDDETQLNSQSWFLKHRAERPGVSSLTSSETRVGTNPNDE
ncbi:MAG: polyphosphate kinase 1 [Acidobacteriales bacterium]|nr:polyphosphate kinase 1 [Terriglobales bacterium]